MTFIIVPNGNFIGIYEVFAGFKIGGVEGVLREQKCFLHVHYTSDFIKYIYIPHFEHKCRCLISKR